MLDRYWWGTVNRISPEAPVPIVLHNKSTFSVGGAANVAANIAGLGATPYLIGVLGNDTEAEKLTEELANANVSTKYLIKSNTRPTTVKTRIIAHNQQVLRLDQEEKNQLKPDESDECLQLVEKLINEIDIVIISDYAKGFLSDEIISNLIGSAGRAGKQILVDPKGKDYKKYFGANILTPNKKEVADASKLDENEVNFIEKAGKSLITNLQLSAILITQGEEGMTLVTQNGENFHFKASAREIYDVTGAGDTVIATLAVSIAAKNNLSESVAISNIAAGLVVEQIGTTAITIDMLRNKMSI